jgi:hypothetical protein
MLLGAEQSQGIAEVYEPWRLRVKQVHVTIPTLGGPSRTETWWEGELDERSEQAIAEHGFNVLVIDPWATYYSGDENSNDQAEAALGQLRALSLRHRTAIVIVHHLSKANDARDPEDLWRGASRLVDWASTRVTLLPHYSERAAREAGVSPLDARRYVDVRILRRAEPTPPFSAVLDDQGWWCRWANPTNDRTFDGSCPPEDVARACQDAGGSWPSIEAARWALGLSRNRTREVLSCAVEVGVLDEDCNGSSHTFRLHPDFVPQDPLNWREESF